MPAKTHSLKGRTFEDSAPRGAPLLFAASQERFEMQRHAVIRQQSLAASSARDTRATARAGASMTATSIVDLASSLSLFLNLSSSLLLLASSPSSL